MHLKLPELSSSVRVDAGFVAGDEVSSHYDPMVAKLIVQGPDRETALRKLSTALEEYEVAGPVTNIEFLKRVCQHPSFIAGDVETGFIPKHREALFRDVPLAPEVYVQAALGTILRDSRASMDGTGSTIGFTSGLRDHSLRFITGTESSGKNVAETEVLVKQRGSEVFDVTINGISYLGVQSHWDPEALQLISFFPHTRLDTRLVFNEGRIDMFQQGTQYRLQYAIPKWIGLALGVKDVTNSVLAPMPCKILKVLVVEGDAVTKDQALVVIESMKMETTIRSSQDGTVSRIVHRQGVSPDIVVANALLILTWFQGPL